MNFDLDQPIGNERFTSIILLCANVVPLIGVLFFDWDLQTVMLLYWIENLIVGLTNIVRILFMAQSPHLKNRLFSAAFFTVHYGLFCMAHGSLLFNMLDIEIAGITGTVSPIDMVQNLPAVYLFLQQTMGASASVALIGMLLSHGFSLNTHYFKAGERHRLTVSKAMHMPYQRIIVMHIGLMGGVFLIEEFGATVLLLVALVAAKIGFDFVFHRKEHRAMRATQTESTE